MRRALASVVAAAALDVGCVLCPRLALAHAQPTTTVQFDREIVRILDNHCVVCHVDGGPAFPLVTYEQTYASRWKIRQDALDRRMAPWAAVPGFGDFANGNGLTQREIDFLVSWAESYGPRNNGEVYTGVAALPTASKVVKAHFDPARWALGEPDLQLRLPENTIAPRQASQIVRTIVDPRSRTDRWLRGLEYKPGDRRVVRAASFYVQETGQWIGSWTPWYDFVSFPAGLALRLPGGSHIVAEIRYRGSKEPVVDRGSLGLYFADAASPREITSLSLEATAVPAFGPGTSRKLAASQRLAADTNILALEPEIHPGVQSIEVSARLPDGTRHVLLFARDIPLEWPTPYIFARTVSLRKGTELSVIEHYASDAALPKSGARVTLSTYPGTALASDQPSARSAPASSVQRFKLTGTVKSIDPADGRLVVQHAAIPGFMGAMTMAYSAGKHENLKSIRAGDQIQSDVVVSDTGTYLEGIKVTRKGNRQQSGAAH